MLPELEPRSVETDRLRMCVREVGPPDGIPVVLVHGLLASARFFDGVLVGAPSRYRLIAPDMRGFGDTEPLVVDATRGLRDWADDVHSLLRALGIEAPVHLAGWSTGGAAAAAYALDRPVASLTLIDPVPPYGFGGTWPDGTPCFADFAGTGAGTGNPDLARRIAEGDRSGDSPLSPRNLINAWFWSASHREPREREDVLVDEVLKSVVGDAGYPGDSTDSAHWPGFAPGARGVLNALSPRYCSWAKIVELDPKPPILWTHGARDIVVADGSPWETGALGASGRLPGWPGHAVFPPQPMVTQIRTVLEGYRDAGGRVDMQMFEDSGHFPVVDAAERWKATFFGFLDSVTAPTG